MALLLLEHFKKPPTNGMLSRAQGNFTAGGFSLWRTRGQKEVTAAAAAVGVVALLLFIKFLKKPICLWDRHGMYNVHTYIGSCCGPVKSLLKSHSY